MEVHALMKVLIGVDPHKGSVAVAAIDEAKGELIEGAGFSRNRDGLRALERWAKRFPERRWAVENAGGLGRHLAVGLAASGESVVDVPPKLSARVRVLSSGNSRKNDGLDALATALAASRNERLAAVDPEAASDAPRLLSERREDLVAERTRALNRLHGLLRDLLPGGVARTLSADRAARILRGVRSKGLKGASARLRRRLDSEVLRDIRMLDRKIADLNGRIEAEVDASGTTLTEIFGVGPILAARIIGTVGDVTRFPSKAHFASYYREVRGLVGMPGDPSWGCSVGSAVTDRRASSVSWTNSESDRSPSWSSQRPIATSKAVTATWAASVAVNSSTPRSRNPTLIASDSMESFRSSRSRRPSSAWMTERRVLRYPSRPSNLVAATVSSPQAIIPIGPSESGASAMSLATSAGSSSSTAKSTSRLSAK